MYEELKKALDECAKQLAEMGKEWEKAATIATEYEAKSYELQARIAELEAEMKRKDKEFEKMASDATDFEADLHERIADLETALAALRARRGEQLPKEGEWLSVDDGVSYFKCSVCGEINCCRGKYCPDCGARMKGEQE